MKRFNFDEFLWFIIIILLDISLCYLVITGKIDLYVGKKMVKYIYIAILMLSIIGVFQIDNIFKPIGNNGIKMKFIPIILVLILGVISVNSQATFKHMELNKDITQVQEGIYVHDHNAGESDKQFKETSTNQRLKDKQSNDHPIVINEDNPMLLEDIRLNSENYIGKEIEIHGFVCKESYLNKNQFIIGRVVMTCCAADSKVVGIIGEWEKAYDLMENQWVYVRGSISYTTIADDDGVSHKVPIIRIDKLEIENKVHDTK